MGGKITIELLFIGAKIIFKNWQEWCHVEEESYVKGFIYLYALIRGP